MDYAQITGKILSNGEVAPGHFRMVLEAPYIAGKAVPGQFVMVRVGRGNSPLLRRPFSICMTAGGTFEILYRVVGEGTRLMAEMSCGAGVDILGPFGRGFDTTAGGKRPVLVAGGIGVAPLLFLARALAEGGAGVKVLIGGKRREEILSLEELEAFGAAVLTATEDGSEGYRGYVTALLESLLNEGEAFSSIYSCGPLPMLREVARISADRGVPCQLSLETLMACGFGVCLGCIVKVISNGKPRYDRVCSEGPVFDAKEILWDDA